MDHDTKHKHLRGPSGSFSLAPGGIESHEGHKIIISTGDIEEIHLFARHAEMVSDAYLKSRLENIKVIFNSKRRAKIEAQQEIIKNATERINELMSAPPSKSAKKQERRNKVIKRQQDKIDQAQAEIKKYNSINENDRFEVFQYLDRWRKRGEPMVTDVATKFTDHKIMIKVITAALKKNQLQIDEAFIDKSGKPKPVGTTVSISDVIREVNLGKGYQLDLKMQVVPLSGPLQNLTIHLIISGLYEYMVRTAYLSL